MRNILEKKVEERTAELLRTNELLKNELEMRERSQKEKEELINRLKERQLLLERQRQEAEKSRIAIRNVAMDLEESKRILELQRKRLEDINKELDDFTYMVSHDLKEPLRSIDAFTKFVIEDYQDKIDDTGRMYLERIRANVSRMQELIEDLLELSRIERGQYLLERVNITDIVNDVLLRLEYLIKERNAIIKINGNLPTIFCDKVRIAEVLFNLISNAIKFNDKKTPVVEIGCKKNSRFYEFYVKDNGPGIDEKYHKKIFEIFQRVSPDKEKEGTGIGLTIVKRIIDMQNGNIRIESRQNKGTIFYFTIPKNVEYIKQNEIIDKLTTTSEIFER